MPVTEAEMIDIVCSQVEPPIADRIREVAKTRSSMHPNYWANVMLRESWFVANGSYDEWDCMCRDTGKDPATFGPADPGHFSAELTFPPEWTRSPVFEKPPRESAVEELRDEDGKCRGAIFGLRFDGCRLFLVSWGPQGGARFARITRDTDWALEERFEGDPSDELKETVDRAWRDGLALLAAAAQAARRAGGRR
ncbi:MAG TPA: hypothetical protein VMS60_15745 [Solirubrobacterales bacterium]|nr:hypothetical protein [Solirubrobacterales bacterium]